MIIGGTAAIAGMVLGYCISNEKNKVYRKAYKGMLESKENEDEVYNVMSHNYGYDSSVCRDVDEDIYTDLAAKLENAVLADPKVETYYDERWYDLDPVTHRKVTINMDTTYGY